MPRRFVDRIGVRLATLDASGLRRSLRPPAGRPIGTNDYLGLAADPAIRQALEAAASDGLGMGSTGSRLLSGHHPRLDALEARVADWQGAEAAVLYSSGFLANQGLLGALLEPGDVVVSDALNHASLIDAVRLTKAERRIVPHGNLDALRRAIDADRPTVVVVESVYSMDGDGPDLAALAACCTERGAALVVDEAHATGLYGPSGQGRVVQAGVRDQVFATVHPAGKAWGAGGAFVVGSTALRDLQLQRARSLIYSTAPPPLLVVALARALDRIVGDTDLRMRPRHLADRLRRRLGPAQGLGATVGGHDSPIVPVIVGTVDRAARLAGALRERDWDVHPIRPPTVPDGTARIRLVMRADLAEADVDTLADDVLGALRAIAADR